MTKQCKRCGEVKKIEDFGVHKIEKDGRRKLCRKCHTTRNMELKRTRAGVIKEMYYSQRASSKKRGHKMPEYSIRQFENWILEQGNFDALYEDWVESGFLKELRPSADRDSNQDDYDKLPYSLARLRLVTWKENVEKNFKDLRSGKTKTSHKEVVQIDKEGNIVNIFPSAMEAKRRTGISNVSICNACNGYKGATTAGGYLWKHGNSCLKAHLGI